MSITTNTFGTGLGITGSPGTYRWNGHAFNPTSDTTDGYQTWDCFNVSSSSRPTLSGATSSFSLTNYKYGHEVALTLLAFTSSIDDNGTATITIYDPSSAVIGGPFSMDWSAGAGGWWYLWYGVGIKNDGYYTEVTSNGTYTSSYEITYNGGGSSKTGSYNWTVTNIPTRTSSSNVGALWVEGDNLCFMSAQDTKIVCANDGTSYATGISPTGNIWLETDGKIAYVDSSGVKRMTKKGDRYGNPYQGSTEVPSTPGSTFSGAIWASNSFDDTYLMFISNNGVKYRLGVGYYTTGDYQ